MAIESIEISGYQVIQKPLTLENLAKVNYLVGPNGCGKSSILQKIHNLYRNDILYNFLQPNDNPGSILINVEESERGNYRSNKNLSIIYIIKLFLLDETFFRWAKKRPDRAFLYGYIFDFFKSFSKISNRNFLKMLLILALTIILVLLCLATLLQFNIEISGLNMSILSQLILLPILLIGSLHRIDLYRFKRIEKANAGQMNESIYLHGCKMHLENKTMLHEPGSKILAELRKIFFELGFESDFYDNRKVNFQGREDKFQDKSSGEKNIINFGLTLLNLARKNIQIILIDEPEVSLHPSFQKLIPKILDILSKRKEFENIQFFVATHSPFIISESGNYHDQKVYLIEGGECANSVGYPDFRAREVVNQMLGVEESDFLPSEIIFCEQSLRDFLQIINYRFYSLDINFKTPLQTDGKEQGCDPFALDLADLQSIIEKGAKNLLPTKYKIVIDVPNEDKLEKKLKNLENKYPDIIIKLNAKSFEEKFGQEPKVIDELFGGKPANARKHAEEITKKEFEEKLFPELAPIFGF